MNKFYELNVGEIKKKAYNEGHKARTEEIIKIADEKSINIGGRKWIDSSAFIEAIKK
jgi:hypothetical protein